MCSINMFSSVCIARVEDYSCKYSKNSQGNYARSDEYFN